jgi:flagellar biosynthetic protein FlhB
MAQEAEDGQEKTEEPSEKRLQDAVEKGQVARSRELANAAVFGMCTLVLMTQGAAMASAAARWMRQALSFGPAQLDNVHGLPTRFGELLLELLLVASPVLAACLLAGFFAPVVMGGIHFSASSLMPNPGKLNPLAGLRRIYSTDGLAELVRSVLRVLLIGGMAAVGIYHALPLLTGLMHVPLGAGTRDGLGLMLHVMVLMTEGLILLAGIDVFYQRWSHRQKLMMTRQEMLEEHKESQGRPEVKAKIRRAQQALSQRRMMEDVPAADVILVNPTHYAVALKYEAGSMRAPKLVAKGADEIALIIRKVGAHHNVPIVTSPPLARSLYRQVEIGREIPANLYAAVALILGYVYQLNTWRQHGGRMPEAPTVDVPEEED